MRPLWIAGELGNVVITQSHPGSESMNVSSRPHYRLALFAAVALVVVPWCLIGWLIWTLA